MSRFAPRVTPQGKIKFNYVDYSSESAKKYIKMAPVDTKVSDLIKLCLKNENPDAILQYDIEINDKFVCDYNKNLSDFEQPILVNFHKKKKISSIFYTKSNRDGENVSYSPIAEKNFKKLILNIDMDDFYQIWDINGKEVKFDDNNYEKHIKAGEEYYLINYPLLLKDYQKKSGTVFFNQLLHNFSIELDQLKQILCIFYKLEKDVHLREEIFKKLDNEIYHPVDFIIKSIGIDFKNPLIESDDYLNLIYSLAFIKEDKEDYINLFEKIYGKPLVFDSSRFIFNKKIEKETIIKLPDGSFGIFKMFSPDGSNFTFYDPYQNKYLESSIDSSNITDPNQITAIFVDTSGTMREAFMDIDENAEAKPLFEAAAEIANTIIKRVQGFNIYDPLLLFTSAPEKVPVSKIPLKLEKEDVHGKTYIYDKLKALLDIIIDKKYQTECPRHIVIITDGHDTASTKMPEDVLKTIRDHNVIIDSIILRDDETSQNPFKFSNYTNGVYLFANKLKSANEFVSQEPFIDIKLRTTLRKLDVPRDPFKVNVERASKFEQLDIEYNERRFYFDFDTGLLKPSLGSLKGLTDDILAKELMDCIDAEGQQRFYTFLVRGRDPNDYNITPEMLKHWCCFIKFDENSFFWQLQIDFDSNYPDSLPRMRIISHPNLIQENEYISKFGTLDVKLYKGSVLDTLKNLIDYAQKLEIIEFKTQYKNSPSNIINESLSNKIKVRFLDGWTIEKEIDFDTNIKKQTSNSSLMNNLT